MLTGFHLHEQVRHLLRARCRHHPLLPIVLPLSAASLLATFIAIFLYEISYSASNNSFLHSRVSFCLAGLCGAGNRSHARLCMSKQLFHWLIIDRVLSTVESRHPWV